MVCMCCIFGRDYFFVRGAGILLITWSNTPNNLWTLRPELVRTPSKGFEDMSSYPSKTIFATRTFCRLAFNINPP